MDESLRPYFIFVEGADTLPKKVPVFLVYGEKEALRICEAIEETEYGEFNFSFVPYTTENVNKIAAWTEMALDVQKGVYGEIVAGICYMIGQIYERHKKLFSEPEENNSIEAAEPAPTVPLSPDNLAYKPAVPPPASSKPQAHKASGGRNPKWDKLIELDHQMRVKNPNVTDKEVVKKYNLKYAGPIARGLRKAATTDALQEARRYRNNRESSVTHDGQMSGKP